MKRNPLEEIVLGFFKRLSSWGLNILSCIHIVNDKMKTIVARSNHTTGLNGLANTNNCVDLNGGGIRMAFESS